MKFDLFLFDLDDTLFDFGMSEKLAFEQTLKAQGYTGHIPSAFNSYRHISSTLWTHFEQKLISKETVLVRRFEDTFKQHKINLDYELASKQFLENLPQNIHLIDGALSICETLKAHGPIGIVTNGVDRIQKARLNNSPLKSLIDFIIVSDGVGAPKPHPEIFEATMKTAGPFDPSKTIMVGDKLETDIQGANNFGMKSCWYNPKYKPNATSIKPTFEVRSLSRIVDLLS